jgi:hypothetical protein
MGRFAKIVEPPAAFLEYSWIIAQSAFFAFVRENARAWAATHSIPIPTHTNVRVGTTS